MTIENGHPYNLKFLAERWQCSQATIRKMCRAGRLGHFLIGTTTYRIPVAAVIAYEKGEPPPMLPPGMEEPTTKAELKGRTPRVILTPDGPIVARG